MSFQVVVTGDNHLNAFYSKFTPDQLEARRRRLMENFQATIDYALKERAALYLNCGDLFDMPNPRTPAIIGVTRGLRKLYEAGTRAFLVSGTHDTPKMRTAEGGAIPQRIFEAQGHAHVFWNVEELETVTLDVGALRVAVSGLSTNPLLRSRVDPLQGKAPREVGDLNILITHYAVEGRGYPGAEEPCISLETLRSLSQVELSCIGHIHRAERFRLNEQLVVVPGCTDRVTFSEKDTKPGFWTIEASKAGLEPEFIELPSQPMKELAIKADSINWESPTDHLTGLVLEASGKEQMLKLRLEGSVDRDLYHRLSLRQVLARGVASNFSFEIDRSSLELTSRAISPSAGGRLSQREELANAAGSIAAESVSEEERRRVEEARRLVLDRYGEMSRV